MGDLKPASHLHTLQVVVATIAGIISIVGGIYSLKTDLFQKPNPYGELTGSVRDIRLAKPLRLATVEILNDQAVGVGTLSTDDAGVYLFKELKEGDYLVRASAPFHLSEEKRLSIEKNRTSHVDFNLHPIETMEPPSRLTRPVEAEPEWEAFPRPRTPSYEPPVPMPYPHEPLPDNDLTQKQPTASELLVQTGAALLEQMLTKKKTDSNQRM